MAPFGLSSTGITGFSEYDTDVGNNAGVDISGHCATLGPGVCSVIHRTGGVRVVAVLLELGAQVFDGRVNTAGVTTDDPVDERRRIVEILRGGQQVRVLPD